MSQSDVKLRTPVPLKKIFILGLILSVNNMSIYMIFSFLPFMIKFYFPDLDIREAGNKAGLLGSAFSLGGIVGNFLWGAIADVYGRRVALLLGLIGSTFFIALFGVSPNYACAVFSRLIWGLSNGNIGVGKTYLGEILDDTNSLRGTSYYVMMSGFGRTLGPIFGGYLSEPSKSYPSYFRKGEFFDIFPFALPCFALLSYTTVVIVLAYLFLPETLLNRKEFSCANPRSSSLSPYDRVSLDDTPELDNEGDTILAQDQARGRHVTFKDTVTVTFMDSGATSTESLGASAEPIAPSFSAKYLRLLRRRKIRLVMLVYFLASVNHVVVAEIFPLWAATSREDGGFQFTTADIGFVLMMSGLAIMVSQLMLYPLLAEAVGALKMLRYSLFGLMLALTVLPSVRSLPGSHYEPLCYTYVIVSMMLISVLGQFILVTIFALINNSSSVTDLATVNVIGQTCNSLGRFIGPYAAATMFAWTETNRRRWPFNFALSWYTLALLALVIIKLSRALPVSIEWKKRPIYTVIDSVDQTVPLSASPNSASISRNEAYP
jgi:MFS family permease